MSYIVLVIFVIELIVQAGFIFVSWLYKSGSLGLAHIHVLIVLDLGSRLPCHIRLAVLGSIRLGYQLGLYLINSLGVHFIISRGYHLF